MKKQEDLLKKRYPDFDANKIDYKLRAVRTSSDKLICNVDHENEFYHLPEDPYELNNIKDAPQSKPMLKILDDWLSFMNQKGNDGKTNYQSEDKESLERLRSLGYIE